MECKKSTHLLVYAHKCPGGWWSGQEPGLSDPVLSFLLYSLGKCMGTQLQGLLTPEYAAFTFQVHVLTMLCSILLWEGSLDTRMEHMVGKSRQDWRRKTERNTQDESCTSLCLAFWCKSGDDCYALPQYVRTGACDKERKLSKRIELEFTCCVGWVIFPSCSHPGTEQANWNGIWAAALWAHVTVT